MKKLHVAAFVIVALLGLIAGTVAAQPGPPVNIGLPIPWPGPGPAWSVPRFISITRPG